MGPEKHGIDSGDSLGSEPVLRRGARRKVMQTPARRCTGRLYPVARITLPNGKYIAPRGHRGALCPTQADCAGGGQSNGNITITNFFSFWILGYEMEGGNVLIDAELMGSAGEIDRVAAPASRVSGR